MFGLIIVFSIVAGSAFFSILSIAIDNLGDKCIELIDKKRAAKTAK